MTNTDISNEAILKWTEMINPKIGEGNLCLLNDFIVEAICKAIELQEGTDKKEEKKKAIYESMDRIEKTIIKLKGNIETLKSELMRKQKELVSL